MKLIKLRIRNFLSIEEVTLNLMDKGLVSIEGENRDKTGSDSNGSGKSSIINSILWCLYGSYGKDEAADDVVNSEAGKDCMVESTWDDSGVRYRITRYRKDSKFKNAIVVTQDRIDITKAGMGAAQQQIDEIMGADEMVFRASCFMQQENTVDIPSMRDRELKDLLERCLPFEDFTEAHKKASDAVRLQTTKRSETQSDIFILEAKIGTIGSELAEARKSFDNFDRDNRKINEEIEEKIVTKKSARAVARTMSLSVEHLKEQSNFTHDELRKTFMLNTDVGGWAARFKIAGAEVEKIKKEIASPKNTCDSCGQIVEDITKTVARARLKLFKAEERYEEAKKIFHEANDNLKISSDAKIAFEEAHYKFVEAEKAITTVKTLDAEIKALEASLVRSAVNPHGTTVKRLETALRASQDELRELKQALVEIQDRLEVLEAVQLTFSPKGLRYYMLETVAPKLTEYTNKYLGVLTDGAITATWSTVTRTAKGDFKEQFSIEAKMGTRNKFGLLSGGQKRKVRLACFFALQDLIAERATKNIDIWCGDEIDEALDGAGLERLMVLLNEKVKTKSTILVISHNELREWIPNHAIVTMEDGQSTITGYLNE